MVAKFKSPDLTTTLLPAIASERGILAMLVISQILAILLAFSPMSVGSNWEKLGIISLFIHAVSMISFSILFLCKQQLNRLKPWLELCVILLVFQLVTLLVSILTQHVYLTTIEWLSVARNALLGLCMQLLFLYIMTIYTEQVNTIKALSKTELEALHARIRPHFLHNSLNTIAELTHIDADAAERAVLALAKLSQAAMQVDSLVALEQEIKLSKQYISLEKWRFGERIVVEWQLPDTLPHVKIPNLTLQPLLENAVNYGVEQGSEQCAVSVRLEASGNSVCITIINDIADNPRQGVAQHGMAQNNIKERLSLHFGDDARFYTRVEAGKYHVTLTLPIQELQ